jgi:ATP-binding cassette, subfamily F, member 3
MAHVQATGISLAYGDRDVLANVTVNLSTGDRCALSGANGSGKSSLMKILAGLSRPDSGTLTITTNSRVSYLPQAGITHRGRTLREEVETAFREATEKIALRDELAHQIAGLNEIDPSVHDLIERHHLLEEEVLDSGYYDREQQISRILAGLGFSNRDLGRQTDEFSGGWQMRIALAKVLLEQPDFLLLDEPTNYLDLEARVWLGKYLGAFRGGVLLVSHDRRFLDETVGTIWELFLAALRRYRGTYSDYERQRSMELDQTVAAWTRQQEEIRRVEDFIRRFRATATKAKQVQSRVKQLEKVELIQIPEHLKRIRFKIPAAPRSGREVVMMTDLGRSYAANSVLEQVNLTVERGERVVLVGPNGAGKSTLLRILADRDASFTGSRRYGAGVGLGYYAEDDDWAEPASGAVSGDETVLESVGASATDQTEQQLRNLLGGFLFHGDDVYKRMSVLSGGERSRVAILKLLLQPLNLLVLDEPTNHLDMTSKQVLLDALTDYDGTVVFVSHDRSFIESLATRVIELKPSAGADTEPSEVTDFPGDYHYYAWKAEHATGRTTDRPGKSAGNPQGTTESDQGAHKARRNRIQKLERLMEELLQKLDALQARHQEIQKELMDPLVYGVGASVRRLTRELAEIDAEVAALSEQWEAAELEHDQLLSE